MTTEQIRETIREEELGEGNWLGTIPELCPIRDGLLQVALQLSILNDSRLHPQPSKDSADEPLIVEHASVEKLKLIKRLVEEWWLDDDFDAISTLKKVAELAK